MDGQQDNFAQTNGDASNPAPPMLDPPVSNPTTDTPDWSATPAAAPAPDAPSPDVPAPSPADTTSPLATPAPSTDDSFASDTVHTPAAPVADTAAATDTPPQNLDTPISADTATPASPSSPASTDDLLDLKQQALQQLTPLVSHLDQSPEDEFRTTMMMIQASDNKDLLPKAYTAAQNIPDEKAKAQALLDVVNEINYFTQHPQGQQPPLMQ